MKNRKTILVFGVIATLMVVLVLAYIFKPMTMNDIYKKPNVIGLVLEVNENSILILVSETEDEFKSSDKISVSLDVKLKDSMTDFKPFDVVNVFYDGKIAESYPAQINTVYAILLVDRK